MMSHLLRFAPIAILAAILAGLPGEAHGQPSTKYWIFLDGKPDASETVVSRRAYERRNRRGDPEAARYDREIAPAYLERLEQMGVTTVVRSRWLNAVSAYVSGDLRQRVQALSFVRSVQPVGKTVTPAPPDAAPRPFAKAGDPEYGPSREQLALMNAVGPLDEGINGRGVRLGFLDTSYGSFDHPAFDSLHADGRLIAVQDFVNKPQPGYAHGMSVASVAVGFDSGHLVGPAYGAEVLAAVTEYGPTETNSEEDFFVAGLEWLESMGADVVNVSLGYTTFDRGERSYSRNDLDGDSAVTTVAADRAAALGVVVVVSAGNQACSHPDHCWYYVGTPADGDSVITVGAVTADSARASFSSFGPTADGRTKPDVAALGSHVYLADPDGYAYANGTSFSSPLVAGVICQMLQVNPLLTPMQVRGILRATANRADNPDNAVGWGIVNAAAAVTVAAETAPEGEPGPLSIMPFPNPATDQVFVHINAGAAVSATIDVFDLLGRRAVDGIEAAVLPAGSSPRIPTRGLSSGVYVVVVTIDTQRASKTFVVLR